MKRWIPTFLALLILALPAYPVIIGPLPVTLQNGTTADANQVMSDFNAIVNSVNANAAPLATTPQLNLSNTFIFPQSGPNATQAGNYVNAGQIQTANLTFFPDTGVANALVLTPLPAWTSYQAGQAITALVKVANTGATTLNVSALGAKNVVMPDLTTLAASAIITSQVATFQYDGTQFQLVSDTGRYTTAPVNTSSTYVATTAFVQNQVASSSVPIINAISGCQIVNNGTTSMDVQVCQASDGNQTHVLVLSATITKTQSAWSAGTGGGGKMSAAAMANNTWYYFYLLRRDSDGAADIGFDVSSTAPTAQTGYASANYRYIGARKTQSGSTNWDSFVQHGNYVGWATPPAADVSGSISTANRTLTTVNVPSVRVEWFGHMLVASPGGTGEALFCTDPLGTDVAPSATASPLGTVTLSITAAGTTRVSAQSSCWTNTASQIDLRALTSAGVIVQTIGWTDSRGVPN